MKHLKLGAHLGLKTLSDHIGHYGPSRTLSDQLGNSRILKTRIVKAPVISVSGDLLVTAVNSTLIIHIRGLL